ncbi:MAG: ABC transporter ATP-binding protein, partial [Bacteroidales bacterium]|nr:ABC transporter ATP-binding protein [Bacteroidales bacterium]
MEKEVVLKLENVSKSFTIRDSSKDPISFHIRNLIDPGKKRVIRAVKNVSLEIYKGEFIGIVGANGSGKSTLLHLMSGVYLPDKGGKVIRNGSYIRLSLGLGFNGELTMRENIYLNASIMGLTFKQIGRNFHKMVEFAELEDFIDTKIKYFSRGMKSRLAFAIAIHAEAEIFLMDEFFGGVGDEKFREKSDKVFKDAFISGRTIIHVSHNMGTIKEYADRVFLMHKGECIATGTPD